MGKLNYQFQLIQAIRFFFNSQGFLDVITPPAVQNPGMETHIHPFQLYHSKSKALNPLYLHTSPEFCMKELLADKENDFNNIFTINYCFRDEPHSEIHRSQFLMLEWYRKNSFYTDIMDDCENLINSTQDFLIEKQIQVKNKIQNFQRVTIQDLFLDILGFNILEFLDAKELELKIRKDFKSVILPDSPCSWDDYYFLLFLNEVEPILKNHPYILLYEFPAPLAALSTIKVDKPEVCERFEIYLSGVELCNCFNELTDVEEQVKRFKIQQQEKLELYNYELPWPTNFINSLNNGLPKSSGIALGVERLLYSLTEVENPFYK
jgi:lysyl-tRNA synthetase class 2